MLYPPWQFEVAKPWGVGKENCFRIIWAFVTWGMSGGEPPSICAGESPGVSSHPPRAMWHPKLAKATEGKINQEEGLLDLCWKADRGLGTHPVN